MSPIDPPRKSVASSSVTDSAEHSQGAALLKPEKLQPRPFSKEWCKRFKSLKPGA